MCIYEKKRLWMGAGWVVLLVAMGLTAAANTTVTYQGVLAEPGGGAVADGVYPMDFAIYNAAAGGVVLWEETGHSVQITQGAFAAELGAITPFAALFHSGDPRWLAIAVDLGDGMQVFDPRVSFTMAPYAGNAATLGGNPAANFWHVSGNADTTPGTHFLGTTDDTALELGVNGQRTLRIEPHAIAPNVIGGFNGNSVEAGMFGATISGGGAPFPSSPNQVTASFGTIGGGHSNTAFEGATVGGGSSNTASDSYATVSGGRRNTASNFRATVGGGEENTASGSNSTVSGGLQNSAAGQYATTGGGRENSAEGNFATVPGGGYNIAAGDASFAAGRNAQANHHGSFVWGDNDATPVASTAQNQFTARTKGGARFFTNSALTTGVELPVGGGAWSSVSDRNVKANVLPVDALSILEQVAQLPIGTWNYLSQSEDIRHIGPMAQDFYAAFDVGESERHINSIDASGVALAAIQGLNQRLEDKDQEITALRTELDALKAMMHQLSDK